MTARTLGYWITTVLAALLFTVPGIGLLGRLPHFVEDMSRLGYPLYFLTLLGVWKILGAIAIVAPGFPRLKEWAYAGMVFDLSSAAVSRAVVGDTAVKMIVPCIIGCVVLISWALRSNGRCCRKQPSAHGKTTSE